MTFSTASRRPELNIFIKLFIFLEISSVFINYVASVPFFDDDYLFNDDVSRNLMRRELFPGKTNLADAKHGIKMGISDSDCDDAKTNLKLDWDGSPVNYTCYTPKQHLPENPDILPAVECDDVPEGHTPQHFCMDTKLTYNNPLPTFADHRPLWAQYGEYLFVPPQRWSHNVEHGAVVMLYHPCSNPSAVKKLKRIVKDCTWKYVIAASNMVPTDRPLVLVTWGCRLRMNTINTKLAQDFIKAHALRGPEGSYTKNGQYNKMIIEPSHIPTGSVEEDVKLCPYQR